MVENIEIKKEELEQLLLDYYRKIENKNIEIDFKTDEEYVEFYEERDIVTRIKLRQNIKLGNQTVSKEREISKKELKEILNEMLQEQGYKIINLIFNNQKQSISYYEEVGFYFKGLKLSVEQIQKQKVR